MAPPPWGWSPKIFNPVAIRLFLRKRAPAAPPGTPRQPRPLSPARLGRVTLPSDVGRPDRSCPPALRARRDHRHRWVFGNAFARLPFLSSSVVLFTRRPRQPGARHPAPVQSTGQRSCGASYLSSFSRSDGDGRASHLPSFSRLWNYAHFVQQRRIRHQPLSLDPDRFQRRRQRGARLALPARPRRPVGFSRVILGTLA